MSVSVRWQRIWGWGLVRLISASRLRYAYLLTPAGMPEKSKLTAEFLKRKVAEYDLLQREIDELESEIGGESP